MSTGQGSTTSGPQDPLPSQGLRPPPAPSVAAGPWPHAGCLDVGPPGLLLNKEIKTPSGVVLAVGGEDGGFRPARPAPPAGGAVLPRGRKLGGGAAGPHCAGGPRLRDFRRVTSLSSGRPGDSPLRLLPPAYRCFGLSWLAGKEGAARLERNFPQERGGFGETQEMGGPKSRPRTPDPGLQGRRHREGPGNAPCGRQERAAALRAPASGQPDKGGRERGPLPRTFSLRPSVPPSHSALAEETGPPARCRLTGRSLQTWGPLLWPPSPPAPHSLPRQDRVWLAKSPSRLAACWRGQA